MEDEKNVETETLESEETEIESNPFTADPVELRTMSEFDTPAGSISVVHEITLGDLIISTILMALLIFYVINQLVRRF